MCSTDKPIWNSVSLPKQYIYIHFPEVSLVFAAYMSDFHAFPSSISFAVTYYQSALYTAACFSPEKSYYSFDSYEHRVQYL